MTGTYMSSVSQTVRSPGAEVNRLSDPCRHARGAPEPGQCWPEAALLLLLSPQWPFDSILSPSGIPAA